MAIRKGKDNRAVHTILESVSKEIIKLDGTITAEHGDGLARSEFIKKQYGTRNYKIFKKIKNYFDPVNVLNPGKIITTKSTIIQNLEEL